MKYAKWTDEEEAELIKGFKAGETLEETSKRHGRTGVAVAGRLESLGYLVIFRGAFYKTPEGRYSTFDHIKTVGQAPYEQGNQFLTKDRNGGVMFDPKHDPESPWRTWYGRTEGPCFKELLAVCKYFKQRKSTYLIIKSQSQMKPKVQK